MPSLEDHKRKAGENEAFVQTLRQSGGTYRDWIVIGLFYAALHHVSALLHHCGCSDVEQEKHSKRRRELLRKLPGETQLDNDYRQLKDDSEDARYECRAFSEAEVAKLQKEEFARLKARVGDLLP